MKVNDPTGLALIRTKLAPPRIECAPVARTALIERLDRRSDRRLLLALGPAGCGKTMLLTQWRQHVVLRGASVAWYNVGIDDDDAVIASYLVEALRHAGLPIPSHGLRAYLRSGGSAPDAFLAPIIDALEDCDRDLVLVIDDFHYVRGAESLRLLDRWIEYAPSRFRLALGSRARPALSLARLQAADQLTELTFDDLRFELGETRSFFAAQGLPALPPEQVLSLHKSADGWAAGLQLLAFSLRRQPKALAGAALAPFQGQSRAALHEYLESTTVHELSAEELEFLVRISACRRFNQELCEFLTGNSRAGDLLERFRRANLFLLPIDTVDTQPWFRFHQLFATFLNDRLARRDRSEVRKLHSLAAHWFAARDLFTEAVRHAALADDHRLLIELLERASLPMLRASRFEEFLRWCEAIPRRELEPHIGLCIVRAYGELACLRPDAVAESMKHIEAHAASHRSAESLLPGVDLSAEILFLRAHWELFQDRSAEAAKIVAPLLARGPSGNDRNDVVAGHILGLTEVYAGRYARAREIARMRFSISDRSPEVEAMVPYLVAMEGFSYLVEGDMRGAVRVLESVIQPEAHTDAQAPDVTGILAGLLAESYYQSNDLDQARAVLERYFDFVFGGGLVDSLLFAHRVRARLERIDRRPEAADATLSHLEEAGLRLRLPRLVAWALHDRVTLVPGARKNSLEEIMARLETLAGQRPVTAEPSAADEIGLAWRLAQAEAAFQSQRDGLACLESIERASRLATRAKRSLAGVRLSFMEAAVRLRMGDGARASQVAREQLARAYDFGMRRVIPDLGEGIRELVEALLRQELPEGERQFLRDGLGAMASDSRLPKATDDQEHAARDPLSSRELEILSLQAQGLSVKGIARAIALSHHTVRWHLKNVYAKLGAVSREDALSKARARRIIAR